jgi:hypothetical protein
MMLYTLGGCTGTGDADAQSWRHQVDCRVQSCRGPGGIFDPVSEAACREGAAQAGGAGPCGSPMIPDALRTVCGALGLYVWGAAFAAAAFAQAGTPTSNSELSKETQNPVSRVFTLPLRYQAEFNDGPYRSAKNTFEINQAVTPVRLSDDWALIMRTKLPGYSQPPKKLGEHWTAGLGNGYTTFFLSPAHGDGFYWGAGPVLYYPTATNPALGINKWGAGPSVALVKKDASPWTLGAVVNNIWSPGGPPGSKDRFNSLLLNPFVSYYFGDGWSVGSSPSITSNWLSKAGQQWVVPVGGGIGKVSRIGGQPVKLALDGYYNAVRAQASNENWTLQLTMTFLFAD